MRACGSGELGRVEVKNKTHFPIRQFSICKKMTSLPSRLASLAGWIPVALVFGQHVASPVGVGDCSMAPTLRGPEGERDDGEDGRRRRNSSKAASTSTSTPSSSLLLQPPPQHHHQKHQPSLLSVAFSGGDVVLVDKLSARTQRYKRGDVVLIR